MIALVSLVAVAWIRRTVPLPFTKEILPPEKFMLDAATLVPFAGTLLIALLTSGFYSRSASPRHRPSLLVAIPLQIGLLAIADTFLEKPWPRTIILGAPLLASPLLLLWRRLLDVAWPRQTIRATLVGRSAEVIAAAKSVREGHVPGVQVAAIVTIDERLDDPAWAGTLADENGRAAIRTAEPAVDLTGSEEHRITILELCAPRPFLYAVSLCEATAEPSLRTFGASVLAEVRFDASRGHGSFVKRAIDLALGALLFLLAFPAIAVAAAAVRLDSRGPAFVRQRRLGRGGVAYEMWKLRTMVSGAESLPPTLARDGDERVTRVGRWLRRYRIDELPQLLNVITGDMSLVGPRPEIPEVSERIAERVRGFHLRTLVRPGIAGLAQVESEYDQDPEVKLRYDLQYICRWTPMLDAELLARSAVAALSGRGV